MWIVTIVFLALGLLCQYIVNGGLQVLIKADAKLDAVAEDGCTALMDASTEGKIEMVKLLHEAKADLNVCGRYGTALHGAVTTGRKQMLKVTLSERIINSFFFCAGLVGRTKEPFTLTSTVTCDL